MTRRNLAASGVLQRSGWSGQNHARLRALLCTTALACALVQPPPAMAAERSRPTQAAQTPAGAVAFAIVPQPLDGALASFGAASGVQVLYDSALTRGLTSPGVSGNLPANQALNRLLAGTGLAARFTGARAATLVRATAEAGALTLDPVTVEGQRATALPLGDSPEDTRGYRRGGASVIGQGGTIKETPATVNVVPRDFIEDRSVRRLRDVIGYVPGIQGTEYSGANDDTIFIRGFDNRNTSTLNGVAVPRNYYERRRNLANIDRVEILKGPAGLEYGVAEPGGVVNYVTKKPQSVQSAEAEVEAGSFDYRAVRADATGPVPGTENLFYRVIASADKGDSFRDTLNTENVLVAGSLLLRYGERSSVLAEVEYNYRDQPYDRGTFYLEGAGFERNFAPIERSFHEPGDYLRNRLYRGAVYLDQELGDHLTFKAAVDVNRADYDSFGARNPNLNGLYVRGTNRWNGTRTVTRSLSEVSGDFDFVSAKTELEGRFSAGPADAVLTVGVSGYDVDARTGGRDGQTRWPIDAFNPVYGTSPTVIGSATTTGRDFRLNIDEREFGGYVQGKVDLYKSLHLLGGIRLSRNEYKDTYVDHVTLRPTPSNTRIDDNLVSWRLAAAYDVTQQVTVFAGVSNGFVPQSGTDWAGNTFEPLKAISYEGGVKVGLFEDRLLWTTSAYQITQSRIAEPDPNNLPGQNFQALLGEVRVRGLETELTGKLTDQLDVIGGVSLMDAEITRSNRGQQGNRPYNVPRFQAGLWGKYDLSGAVVEGLSLGLGVIRVGEREGDNANSFQLPAYTRVDAGVFYRWNNLQAKLTVENVFDTTYFIGSQNRAQNIAPGAPTTVIGGLKLTF